MLPKINNKSFLECTEDDFGVLKENPDYRENEYIDYKKNFAFLEMQKGKDRNAKILEFKSDVCAFANAEGGYLIFGISDENGCAKEIIGIDIDNDDTDKFELDRRNNLNGIYPRTPYLKFHFIKLENGKYIVTIFVKHDSFAPYTHIENERSYFMYKRSGNGKRIMSYTEVKNMFNQSISLDKEIYNYRIERINYYKSQAETKDSIYSRFILLHIIPETFLDSSYNQNMFILEKTKKMQFSTIFSGIGCDNSSIPCVDGLRYTPYDNKNYSECYIKNNGVIECFFHLDNTTLRIGESKYPNGFIPWGYIWNKIKPVFYGYADEFKTIYPNEKIFMCISIIGCKGVVSENEELYWTRKEIDRNLILCSPIPINNLNDNKETELILKKLYIEFLLSISVKNNKELKELIQEVYNV